MRIGSTMGAFAINRDQLRDIPLRNWMTHDDLWDGEVAAKFGMAEVSPMNLRVCRKLGRTEFKRLMKVVEAPPQRTSKRTGNCLNLGKRFSCRSSSPFKSIVPAKGRSLLRPWAQTKWGSSTPHAEKALADPQFWMLRQIFL